METKFCPLLWWKANECTFPHLAKLARKALAIPGGAVSVERVFNCGRDVIGLRRHALGKEALSDCMLGNQIVNKSRISMEGFVYDPKYNKK